MKTSGKVDKRLDFFPDYSYRINYICYVTLCENRNQIKFSSYSSIIVVNPLFISIACVQICQQKANPHKHFAKVISCATPIIK